MEVFAVRENKGGVLVLEEEGTEIKSVEELLKFDSKGFVVKGEPLNYLFYFPANSFLACEFFKFTVGPINIVDVFVNGGALSMFRSLLDYDLWNKNS